MSGDQAPPEPVDLQGVSNRGRGAGTSPLSAIPSGAGKLVHHEAVLALVECAFVAIKSSMELRGWFARR